MNRQDRAKQFAPFDALRGLREALAEKEYENEKTHRRELSEEECDISEWWSLEQETDYLGK